MRQFLGWTVAFILFFALPTTILLEGYLVYSRSIANDRYKAVEQYLTRELTALRNNASNEKLIVQLARIYRDSIRKKLPDFSKTEIFNRQFLSDLPPESLLLVWDGKGHLVYQNAGDQEAGQAFIDILSAAFVDLSQETAIADAISTADFIKKNADSIKAASPLVGHSFPYLSIAAAPGTVKHHLTTNTHRLVLWNTFTPGTIKNGGFVIFIAASNLPPTWGLTKLLAADPTANPEQAGGFIESGNRNNIVISYKPLEPIASRLFSKYLLTMESPVVDGDWHLIVIPFASNSSIKLFTLYSTARYRLEHEYDERFGFIFAALILAAGVIGFLAAFRKATLQGLSLRTKIGGLFGLSMLLPLSILSLLALHYSLDHAKILQDEANQSLQNEIRRLDEGAAEFYHSRAVTLQKLCNDPAVVNCDLKAMAELFLGLYKNRKISRVYLVDASGTILFDQDNLFDEYGHKAFVTELGRKAIESANGGFYELHETAEEDVLTQNFIVRLAAHKGTIQPATWPGSSHRTAVFVDLVPPPPGSPSITQPRALIISLNLENLDLEYLTSMIRAAEKRGYSDSPKLFALNREDIATTIPALSATLRANLLPLIPLAQIKEYPEAERISDENKQVLTVLTSGKNLKDYYLGALIDWSFVTAPLYRAYSALIAALIVNVCGSLLLAMFLIRGVVNPIANLSLGTRAIAAGDLTRILPVFERDELGELSRAFNEMTKRLRNRLAELTVLYTLTQKASTSTNQREVFALAIQHLKEYLGASDGGTVWLDENTGTLILAETRDKALSEAVKRIVYNALQKHAIALDKLADSNLTILGIPLFFEEQDFGGLYLIFQPAVERSENVEFFSSDERNFIETLRHHLSLIIEKQRLFEQAITDGLTRLCVRRFFLATLEKEMARARRYKTDVALLMLDIDHFKQFNDTWGHQVGDMVLRETSRHIIENTRAVDTPGRYGGEELAVILPQTTLKDAAIVGERIRKAIAEAVYVTEQAALNVTVSIGITALCGRNMTLEAFIEECDKALYKAKAMGRNRVVQTDFEKSGESL